jgi:hypothetical protein
LLPRLTDKLASPLAISTPVAATSSAPPRVNNPAIIQFDDTPLPAAVHDSNGKKDSTFVRGVTGKLASPPLAILTQAAETSSPPPRVNNPQRFNNAIIQFDDMPPPVLAVNANPFSRKTSSTFLRGVVAARRAKSRAVQKIVAAIKSVGTKQQQEALTLQAAACHP